MSSFPICLHRGSLPRVTSGSSSSTPTCQVFPTPGCPHLLIYPYLHQPRLTVSPGCGIGTARPRGLKGLRAGGWRTGKSLSHESPSQDCKLSQQEVQTPDGLGDGVTPYSFCQHLRTSHNVLGSVRGFGGSRANPVTICTPRCSGSGQRSKQAKKDLLE